MSESTTVWSALAASQAIQYGVPYIDPNSYQPVLDYTGSALNFAYKPLAAWNGLGVLSIATAGDLSGTDPLSLGAQGDSYIPVVNQVPATVGGIPGFSASVSRGTRALPLVVGDGDTIGEFMGYGYVNNGAANLYQKLAGITMLVQGASATWPGGRLRLGTRANATGTYTDWIDLDNAGAFTPLTGSTPAAPLTSIGAKLGKGGFGWSQFALDYYLSLVAGAVTINKPSGTANIAAGASSVVVTNSLVTANSLVLAVLQFVDGTLTFIKAVVPAAGSFTITGNANATAQTKVAWFVISTD